MAFDQLTGTTAIVTGAGRGFGRGIATALAGAGARVVGVARDRVQLDADEHRPRVLVLNAGAAPLSRPLQRHTWETFSRNWETDVRHVFNWTREALLLPLAPGSVVIAFSSGAALAGSPLSGGYAGAKATIRFIAAYAGIESARAGLGIRVVAVMPRLTPATELGAAAVAAYAEREGVDEAAYRERMGPPLTPELVGAAVARLATDPACEGPAYVLTADGLVPAPA
jgi:NAD(P)-dependent dehydrogenase (short-subunit alcohol dehydrogenase family)